MSTGRHWSASWNGRCTSSVLFLWWAPGCCLPYSSLGTWCSRSLCCSCWSLNSAWRHLQWTKGRRSALVTCWRQNFGSNCAGERTLQWNVVLWVNLFEREGSCCVGHTPFAVLFYRLPRFQYCHGCFCKHCQAVPGEFPRVCLSVGLMAVGITAINSVSIPPVDFDCSVRNTVYAEGYRTLSTPL